MYGYIITPRFLECSCSVVLGVIIFLVIPIKADPRCYNSDYYNIITRMNRAEHNNMFVYF